ncbi:MAG: nitrate reductase, partial [Gammaproteobacteria bacterium]|nr:nitrate reductase [Gammaproteobacteria bacterium]
MIMAATTCPYCGVGCGVDITPQSSGLAPVNGDQTHPANFGRLCVKGSSLHETLGEQGRLLRPRVRGQSVDWDVALAAVADGLGEVLRTHG